MYYTYTQTKHCLVSLVRVYVYVYVCGFFLFLSFLFFFSTSNKVKGYKAHVVKNLLIGWK